MDYKQLTPHPSGIHRVVVDHAHVENGVAEHVLLVRVGAVLDQQVVDVFVAETSSECQGVLAIVGIACKEMNTEFKANNQCNPIFYARTNWRQKRKEMPHTHIAQSL